MLTVLQISVKVNEESIEFTENGEKQHILTENIKQKSVCLFGSLVPVSAQIHFEEQINNAGLVMILCLRLSDLLH